MKGTVEPCETIRRAAQRELLEEIGIVGVATEYLGVVQMSEPEQEWHLLVCRVRTPLPETWTHRTSDGGGLDFEFFWHSLSQNPDGTWHPIFKKALASIKQHINP